MMSILITGCGVISSIGIGTEAFRAGLRSGACGIGPISLWESDDCGAEVRDFAVNRYLESEKTYLDRASAFTLAACNLARREATLEVSDETSERMGVVLGTGYGCLETMRVYYERVLERGARFASSLLFSHSYANGPASLAAIEYRLRGHHGTVCTGLTAGATALAQAAEALGDGRAEAIFAGGVEALAEPLLRGLNAYLGPRDHGTTKMENGKSESGPISNFQSPFSNSPTCQPAKGIVLGEGAGVFVLETTAHAAARGFATGNGRRAVPFLTGVGLSRSRQLGSGEGLERGIRAALREAGRSPEEVDVVFASANGWPAVDGEEAAALRAVFPRGVPVTALKSRWGEVLGAGAALNLAAALSAFTDGQIPATLLPPPDLSDLDLVTEPRPADLRVALLSSVDFGGNCVSLVVER